MSQIQILEERAKNLFDPKKAFGNKELIVVLDAIQEHNESIKNTDECPYCDGTGEAECPECSSQTECPECMGSGRVDKK